MSGKSCTRPTGCDINSIRIIEVTVQSSLLAKGG